MNRTILLLLLSFSLSACSTVSTRIPAEQTKCDAALQACENYNAALDAQNKLLANQVTTVTQQRDQCADQLSKCTAGNPTNPVLVGGVGAGGVVAATLLGGPAGGLGAAGMFIVFLVTKIHF